MKRALITGIAGSGGSYLAEYLINNGTAQHQTQTSRRYPTS